MQHGRPRTLALLQSVDHRLACAPAMDRHDSASRVPTPVQHVLKYHNLCLPMAAEFGAAIKTDLANVARLREKHVEKRQLILPLVRKLRVQTKSCPDALSVRG